VEGSAELPDNDDIEVVDGPEADDDVDPLALRRIWDGNQSQRSVDLHGKPQWKCLYIANQHLRVTTQPKLLLMWWHGQKV
jgi:hypothetical protein